MILILSTYIIIILIQFILVKYKIYNNDKLKFLNEKTLEYNINNKQKIENNFNKEIERRVKLLETGKMNYHDWIKYMNDNIFLNIDGIKYYFFVGEKLNDNSFMIRSHANKGYIDFSWEDTLKDYNEALVSTKYETDKDLLINAYNLSGPNSKIEKIKYYWLDPLSKSSVEKETTVKRWTEKKTGRSGIIGIGKTTEILSYQDSNIQLFKVKKPILALISISTLLLALIIIFMEQQSRYSKYKSQLILILLNIYFYYFITINEEPNSFKSELEKVKEINKGILSVSFLASVNIFILTTLNRELKTGLFTESSIIFGLSMFLLLFATLKNTNYKNIQSVIELRVSNQLIFNYSVLFNTFIIMNFLIYAISIKFKFLKDFIPK